MINNLNPNNNISPKIATTLNKKINRIFIPHM